MKLSEVLFFIIACVVGVFFLGRDQLLGLSAAATMASVSGGVRNIDVDGANKRLFGQSKNGGAFAPNPTANSAL